MASITMSLDDVGCFSKLLLALEESQDQLGVVDYSLGMSSLEDVFMALGDDKAVDGKDQSSQTAGDLEAQDADASAPNAQRTESSEWRCAKAMFTLRLKPVLTSRNRLMTVVVLPAMIQLGGCYLSTLGAQSDNAGTNGYAIAIYPAMSFGIVLLSCGQDLMTDVKNKCKYVSISQGLSARAYWLGNFMAHLLLLLPAAVEFVMIFLLFKPASIPVTSIPLVILGILLYPIPLALCGYNFTVAMAGSESLSKVVPVMLMATQVLPALLTAILTLPAETKDFATAWHIAHSIVNPNYALPGMMAYLVNVEGPLGLEVGGYFGSYSSLPVYMMFLTSSFCLFNLIRLETGQSIHKIEDDLRCNAKFNVKDCYCTWLTI